MIICISSSDIYRILYLLIHHSFRKGRFVTLSFVVRNWISELEHQNVTEQWADVSSARKCKRPLKRQPSSPGLRSGSCTMKTSAMIVTIGWAWVLKKSWSIRPTQTKKVTDCKTDRFGLAVYWIVMNCGIKNSWKRATQWQPYSTLCCLSPTAWSFSTEGRRWRPGQVFDGVCLLMTHIWECRMSSHWPVQGTRW